MRKTEELARGTLTSIRYRKRPDPFIWVFSSTDNVMCNYNSKYLFEYVWKYLPQVTPLFVINDDEKRKKLGEKYGPEHLTETRTTKGMQQVLGAGVWFTSAGLPIYAPGLSKDRIIVNLWHGIPLKRIVLMDPNQSTVAKVYFRKVFSDNYTWILTSSSKLVHVMAESFGVEEGRIRVLGQPRNDLLLNGSIAGSFKHASKPGDGSAAGSFKCASKPEDGSATCEILYAPTFRDGGGTRLFPFDDFDRDRMEEFLKEKNCRLWIRLHPKETAAAEAFISERIRLLGENQVEDVMEVLGDYSALITDYSSIFIDYLLLDRPIIFLPYDKYDYLFSRGMNFNYDEVTPGAKPDTFEDFLDSLTDAMEGRDSFAEERKAVRDFFHEITEPCSPMICNEVFRELEKRGLIESLELARNYAGQADALWKEGKNREALEYYALCSEAAGEDPELRAFLKDKLELYCLAAAESCESLILEGEEESARELARLWLRIFPGDRGRFSASFLQLKEW